MSAVVGPASFDLSGRTALVTGGSRGLGRAVAMALAAMGARVCVTAKALPSLNVTLAKLEIAGHAGLARELDLSDPAMIDRVIGDLSAATGGIDILVNTAGYDDAQPSLEVSEAVWDRIVDANLKGSFFCAQAVARQMAKTGRGGAIINICSLAALAGTATAAPYGASRAGLLGMTRALASEWGPARIRVNAIAPGHFRTELAEDSYRDADRSAAALAKIPQRRFGSMDDVGGAVVFLAGAASSYITGQCLVVDGGYLAALG